MIRFLYIALVTLLISANSEYYPDFSKKIFNVRGDNSYFGYSIAYESQSKFLIVSAPLSNVVGEVFLCNIDNGSCNPVQTNVRSECPGNKISGDQNMWLGAVVKSAPSYYVTCAPRCIKTGFHCKKPKKTTQGQCFIGSSNNMMSMDHLKPIEYKDICSGKFESTITDSYGWSLDVFENKSIAIGGPAMAAGRLEAYSKFDDTPTATLSDWGGVGVNFNFGYSVASGNFIKTHSGMSYAVGSPYGTHGYGKVVFLSSHLTNQGALVEDKNMYKDNMYQVGAMYGSVLCTASFTGHMTDLLVGAPTHATEHRQNSGAVYVYVRDESNMPVHRQTIFGEHDNSYFGSAIVSIGDLNNDEKDEFAIAAPYESEGRGAVYLYSGADVLDIVTPLRPLQRIPAQDNWRTFGLSLSTLQDYDDNGCNELVIGAPESANVMLLRCMASVHVEVYIPDNIKMDNLRSSKHGSREFEFKSCLRVRYPKISKNIIANIEVKVEIIHPDANLKNQKQATYQVYLHRDQNNYCENIQVLIPENGNYNIDIGIHVTASHKDDPMKQQIFDSSRVVLTDNSKLESHRSVWAAECSGNHTCMPDLVHKYTQLSVKNRYTIGSTAKISIAIWVENKGEVAYQACVVTRVYGASVLVAPPGCERKEEGLRYSSLQCAPKQLLRTGTIWNTNEIILDTTSLTNVDETIVIEGELLDYCNVDKAVNNTKPKQFREVIELASDDTGVTVKGVKDVDEGNYVNITKSDLALGKVFEHVYEISNNGPTTWVNIDFQIEVQQLPFIIINKDTLQIDNAQSKCSSTEVKRNQLSHLIFYCKMKKLGKYPIVVMLPMRLKPGVVDLLKKEKEVTVHSKLTFVLHDKKSASLTSILIKSEALVPLWIIICTAFLGLLILAIIGFILRELGCLRRKNKDKLERVRKSVRRQTVLKRQTQTQNTVDRERVNSEEMQAILDDAGKLKQDRRVRVPSD